MSLWGFCRGRGLLNMKTIPVLFSVLLICIKMQAVGTQLMESKLNLADTSLILNGAGYRTAYGLKLYQSGLYLVKKNRDPQQITDANAPMAVRMIILSSLITGERLEKSTREGLHNSTGNNLHLIEAQVRQFFSFVIHDLKKGDVFTFIYKPDKGTDIVKNGIVLGTIDGYLFKKALFGIWLCDKPPQKELKSAMLGET